MYLFFSSQFDEKDNGKTERIEMINYSEVNPFKTIKTESEDMSVGLCCISMVSTFASLINETMNCYNVLLHFIDNIIKNESKQITNGCSTG